MAITSAEFINRFKEFEQVDTVLIDAKLGEAKAMLDELAFSSEELYETAVYYKAAHFLTSTPYGRPTEIQQTAGMTNYGEIFKNEILPLIHRRGQITGGGLT